MNIQIEDLCKNYGSKKALSGINLDIGVGMFGLLGPNGAGKTTLMRILATLLKKSSGSVLLDHIRIEDIRQIRRIIGYLPQEFSFYSGFTVYEAMDYLALLCGIKNSVERKKLINELLEKVNLTQALKVKVKALSGGMKQRLGIAQALLNNPQLLIVDEPTSGLDPEERNKFRNMLSEFAYKRTVILSTHIVSDIESTCEKLAVLKKGCLVYKGSVSELLGTANGKVWEITLDKRQWEGMKLDAQSKKLEIISSLSEGQNIRLRLLSPEIPYASAQPVQAGLEDAYMLLIKEVEQTCF